MPKRDQNGLTAISKENEILVSRSGDKGFMEKFGLLDPEKLQLYLKVLSGLDLSNPIDVTKFLYYKCSILPCLYDMVEHDYQTEVITKDTWDSFQKFYISMLKEQGLDHISVPGIDNNDI